MVTTSSLPTEVVVALGGGAARGLAHVGVLRELAAAGIAVRAVAGTSIGSAIGGLYCAGKLDEYVEFITGLGRRGVWSQLDPVVPRGGLFAGRRLVQLLRGYLGRTAIEDLPLPFCAVAVDVERGDEVRLVRGDLVRAIRASSGVPGLFTPFRVDDRWLVDGGVSSPVPVQAARALSALPIVAVNVNRSFERPAVARRKNHRSGQGDAPWDLGGESPRVEALRNDPRLPRAVREFLASMLEETASATDRTKAWFGERFGDLQDATRARWGPPMVDALYNSIVLLQHNLARAHLAIEPPALLVEPNLEGVGLFDFHLGQALVDEGARAAREVLAGRAATPAAPEQA